MFKNRHFQVKLVKDDQSPVEDVKTSVDPEEISRLTKDLVKYTAVTTAIAVGASIALNTLSQIAVIATEAAINKKD